jgi:glycosyltransferase involved in cell wall biosynthesis
MKDIVTSGITRFVLFEQARELIKAGRLNKIITGWPSKKLEANWSDISDHATSIPRYGATQLILQKCRYYKVGFPALEKKLHLSFSKAVLKSVPADTRILTGMSSFMLPALLEKEKYPHLQMVVDHGSLYERHERRVLEEESDKYGFEFVGNSLNPWIADWQDKEFALADTIIVPSLLSKETLVAGGIDQNRIKNVAFGVDLTQFSPADDLRNRNDKKIKVVCVGAVIPRKGVHYLIFALRKLGFKKFVLDLFGSLPTDKAMIDIFNVAMCEGLEINMHGNVSQQRLNYAYNNSDLFVMPSIADGWGLVGLQALASGTFTIVSSATGSKEAVDVGENGLIFESGNADDLAAKIEISLQQKLIQHGQVSDNWKARYSWKTYGKNFLKAVG